MPVRRLRRYWTLWRTLPADERGARARRVADRLVRRRPGLRRLGLAPDWPRWAAFRRALGPDPAELADRLRRADRRRGPLYVDLDPRAGELARRHPAHLERVLERSRELCEGRLELLGSGPSPPLRSDGGLDWHADGPSGRRWPPRTYHADQVLVRGDGSDVKLPWELSRFQHLLALGQAYHLAPHGQPPEPARELRARVARVAREQIDDWLHGNPQGLGVNWACAMEVALRATSWTAALALFRTSAEWDAAFLLRLARALWTHGTHVRGNLEHGGSRPATNHLLADLVGLLAIGCALPELREAGAWRALAWGALGDQIEAQVHRDGASFERSIPYHRLVTELFLHAALLAEGAGLPVPAGYRERVGRMLEFIACYSRPDGSAPQWGDNDDGRLLPLEGWADGAPHDHRHLLALGGAWLGRDDLAAAGAGREAEPIWLLGASPPPRPAPAPPGSRGFSDVGYYVLRADDLHAGVPCGPVGTAGLGNHTHNDLLSICLWAGGREWITDPGTGSYSRDLALRNRLRGTGAHATVQLGGREQNRLGAGIDDLFRVHDDARPAVTRWEATGRGAQLVARHDGFSARDGRWVHERRIALDAERRCFEVDDRLERVAAAAGAGQPAEPAQLRYPLGCGVEARTLAAGEPWPEGLRSRLDAPAPPAAPAGGPTRVAVELTAGGERFWIGLALPPGARVAIESGTCSPRYGVTRAHRVVRAEAPPAARFVARSILWSPRPGSDR